MAAESLLQKMQLVPDPYNNIVIHAQGLTKQFGDQIAVQDVSFQIPQGSIFGFVGPSGSGKTTTVRLLAGIVEPTAGEMRVLGIDPMKFTQSTRERIGYMPQLFVLYPELTVWENLNFAAVRMWEDETSNDANVEQSRCVESGISQEEQPITKDACTLGFDGSDGEWRCAFGKSYPWGLYDCLLSSGAFANLSC